MDVRNLNFTKVGRRSVTLISEGGERPGENSVLDRREHLKKQTVVKVKTEKCPLGQGNMKVTGDLNKDTFRAGGGLGSHIVD